MNTSRDGVKQKILARFKQINAGVGHIIPGNWIIVALVPELNPKEKPELAAAVEELHSAGLIEARDNGDLALTEKGVDAIY